MKSILQILGISPKRPYQAVTDKISFLGATGNEGTNYNGKFYKKFTLLNALSLLAFVILFGFQANAQISYSTAGSNYTQDFNNLFGSVPANNTPVANTILPTGWVVSETLANANTLIRVDNGSSGTGDSYLDGATSSNERALGSYSSGSMAVQYAAFFTNNTGATLTQFTLSYTGEQWKDGGSGTSVFNALTFSYSVGATSITAGTYTNFPGLDFIATTNNSSSDVTKDGNLAVNRTAKNATVTGISWPAGATLYIRWTDINDAGNDDNLAIDDLTFSASAGVASPNIAITGTPLSAVNTIYGTASATPTSYSVSGTNLLADISITAPSGFEISKTPGGASGYLTSQTLTQSGGTVAATTIYVRLAATTTAGNYSGNISHIAGAASVNVATVPSTVAQKGLTVSGAVANNKVYDGNTAATISGATAVGTVNGDAITLPGGGTFADKNVGTAKPVTAALTISGTNASSYTLTQPTGLTADITQRNFVIISATASNKVYDGNTSATITINSTGTIVSGDDITVSPTGQSGQFASPFVANGIAVTPSIVIGGADAANYNVVQPTGLTANITAKSLTIASAQAQNKVFDGNTDAVIVGTLTGILGGDDVDFLGTGTFAQSAVGNNIAVTSTSTLIGADATNYSLTQPTGLTANISSQPLLPQTITFNPLADVTYGDSAFALTATSDSGLTVSYVSSDTNVATISGNIVTIVGAGVTTITASQQGDGTYDSAPTVDQPLTVNVKILTLNATADNKVYDDTDVATITGTLVGVVGADDVTFIGTGTFASTDVANGIAVTSTSTLGGVDASNYSLTQPTGLTANITPLALTVSNAVASNKVYNGNTNATITGATLNGVLGADNVTVSGNGTFASEDVATGIAVTAALTLGGVDAGNYSLTQPTGLTANITALALTITGLTGTNKVYDGNTTATVSGTGVLNGVVGADNVSVSGTPVATFNNKNVGIAKPIAVTGYSISGADAGNYTVSQPTGITANITPASLTITGAVAQNKVFDGTTAATITGTLSGVITPDVVTLIGTGSFASSAVGNGIAVTSTSTLGGADGGNYTINPQPSGLTANITPAPATLANWTFDPLNGAISSPTPNSGSGSSAIAGSMLVAAPGTATGMNTATGCGSQSGGGLAWAFTTANPGTVNESSGARFNTSTSGYQNIKFTWEQRWSNTSTNTVRLQYTTDGTTWNNFTMTGSNTTFCLGSLNNGRFETNTTGDQYRRISVDLSSITAANNNPSFGVRVVAAYYQGTTQFRQVTTPGTAATAGTWRFDNVKFEAVAIPATPPTASVISGNATICSGDSTNINVVVTDGTSPFTLVYTNGTSNFTVNNYISGAAINVAPTTNTTYTIVSVTDANNLVGTGNSGSAVITVNQLYSFYTDADFDGFGAGALQNGICATSATTPPTGFSLNNTDCNDSVAAINPGTPEVLYNGVDDNCNNQLDEGNQLTTSLLPSICNTTLASINSLIGITTVNYTITGYRVRVTNGAQVQVIERNVPHFSLPNLPSYDYAITYTVEIELQRNGVWLGYYGPSCTISSPAVLAEGGATQVNPSQCGITLPRINTLIATTSLQGATGYRFKVTNITVGASGPNIIQTIDRVQHWFSLVMLTQYNYNSTYRVEVAVKTNGVYSGYGAPCEVTSPGTQLVNCGDGESNEVVIATPNTLVAATSVQGATQYRFQITRVSDNAQTSIDRTLNHFTFNLVPGYSPGVDYAIRVAVMTVGTWSPFGDACIITSPGAAARFTGETAPDNGITASEFKAVVYPNPFASAFAINVSTAATAPVQLKVYDMTGRLIESRDAHASELNTLQVGNNYPSGVYNVIVTQGENVETLKVIKR